MRALPVAAVLAAALFAAALVPYARAESWPGVDETVVEKYASEHGREAGGCLLDIEGDALLFAFLVAGTAGGFVMGYYYRDVVSRRGGGEKGEATDAR